VARSAGAGTILLRNFALGAHAVEANQMQTRARHQSRQALHELQRLHDDMGGAVFVRTLQLQYDLAGAVTLEPFVSDGRPGNVAAELLQFFTPIGAPAHRRVQAKAVRVDMQLRAGRRDCARQALQAQQFLPSSWAQRNTIGARGGLQSPQRPIGVRFGR
jgi:hypothetical protein